jgi:signal transduction histidine kinase
MRWPLRRQIMLPMAAIMLLAVVAVGSLGAFLSARAAKARITAQIAGVTQIIEESNFPLTDAVLRQMKALSGAELVLVDSAGKVRASSGEARQFDSLSTSTPAGNTGAGLLGNRIRVREHEFFHTVLKLGKRPSSRRLGTLHVLFPERDYRRAWQLAVYPSLGFVLVALPIVMWLAAATGSRITRRVMRLQAQVERIAHGEFRQIAVPYRDDEFRALSQAVNRMTAMLAGYEAEVRRTERMRTLASLGGGVAHQLRNSATGCSIALDLHAEQCPTGASCESLSVAKRQLQLMEEYIQRFLRLGKPANECRDDDVDLAALIQSLLPLVQPAARHGGVDLQWNCTGGAGCSIVGDTIGLSQMIINLLLNAIEAAAQSVVELNTPGKVLIALAAEPPGQISLKVSDSGPGPAEGVGESLFEPFITEKPDGIGLGLSVARDVVLRHGGRITWNRSSGMTHFVVELPTVGAASRAAQKVVGGRVSGVSLQSDTRNLTPDADRPCPAQLAGTAVPLYP